MLYRRKIILALLQIFNGELDKIRLQKLLFLFFQKKQNPEYEFVPYKYGCYSYSMNADLTAMVERDILKETESHFFNNQTTNYLNLLKEQDKTALKETVRLYGKMSAVSLMKHTYINFPYWAINSLKAEEILTEDQLQKVKNSKPKNNKTILYTIGYEGVSIENYFNKLIKNDIKTLVDVRNNPLSMKYGFSKSQLKRFCDNLGLEYIHFPEVGIQSEFRQELNKQSDYDKLFVTYRSNLDKSINTQEKILNLLIQKKRIALTCFEANICQCHRKPLAESIASLPNFKYEVKHI